MTASTSHTDIKLLYTKLIDSTGMTSTPYACIFSPYRILHTIYMDVYNRATICYNDAYAPCLSLTASNRILYRYCCCALVYLDCLSTYTYIYGVYAPVNYFIKMNSCIFDYYICHTYHTRVYG